ncbi:hypothetical protein [Peribacillus sp. SCS-155]|uniref:hypothetical protein n=1 Tax=Peribacillus sedimenti TaxID=3115297 RepID=UPI003905D58A
MAKRKKKFRCKVIIKDSAATLKIEADDRESAKSVLVQTYTFDRIIEITENKTQLSLRS